MSCFDLSIVPTVSWNHGHGVGAFDSNAQTAMVISHFFMQGFEQAFLQGFDNKDLSAVLGIYPGKEKSQYQRCSQAP